MEALATLAAATVFWWDPEKGLNAAYTFQC